MCEVKNGFDEKCRELKRMKSSFASIKKQNDDLKLQVKKLITSRFTFAYLI